MNKFFYLCVCSILFSCREQTNEQNFLTESEMVDALVEVHLLESAYKLNLLEGAQADSLSIKDYYNSLFESKPYSIEQFKESFAFYSGNPKIMEALLDSVLTQVQMME